MGIWEYISSTTEAVKRNAQDVKPLNNLLRLQPSSISIRLSESTPTNGYQTEKIPGLMHSRRPTSWSMVELHFLRFLLIQSMMSNAKIVELKKSKQLEEEIGPRKKHWSGDWKLLEGEQMHSDEGKELALRETGYLVSTPNKTPEDVIRVFLMKEFIGNRFLEDLMVPKVTRRKKPANKAE